MMNGTAAGVFRPFVLNRPQWSLGLMLLALHGALAWDADAWIARGFLLAHFGLFLLWQPMFRGEREIELKQAMVVFAFAIAFVWWHTWWLIAVWLAVLFAVIGGSVPRMGDRRHRLVSILAALYLLSLLLMWVVPHLFTAPVLQEGHATIVRYGLPFLPISILLTRVTARPPMPLGIDLFYSVLLFLLVTALVLGSFVIREVSQGAYVIALAQTLFGIAVLLVALSWLWYPRSGFAGIGHLLSSYLMSLGLPFEQWVQRLAALADEEPDPQRFLAGALQHMCAMPWVRGVQWQAPFGQGDYGSRTQHATELESADLRLTIYTRWEVSPAMLLHLKLLAQMIGHFYGAKRREHSQRQNAYAQAIYETGARLTHDVKNLLQSLKALCSAAQTSAPEQAQALHALIQRQLPQITQRLNATLEKLQAPQQVQTSVVNGQVWWDRLVQRYSGRAIEFASDGNLAELAVPAEIFDSIADNLIENALSKRMREGTLKISGAFSSTGGGTFTLCDDGAAIPATVAARLFVGPVPSQSGLGVGLYQSAALAARVGYELALTSNESGSVCFALHLSSDERGSRE